MFSVTPREPQQCDFDSHYAQLHYENNRVERKARKPVPLCDFIKMLHNISHIQSVNHPDSVTQYYACDKFTEANL